VKTFLQFAAVFALLSLGVSTAVLSHDTHRIALDADKTLRDLDEEVKVQSQNLAVDEQHLSLVLDQVQAAAVEQRVYWQKTSADSDKTVKALRIVVDRAGLLMKHTDERLNASLLPDVDREVVFTSQTAQMSIGEIGQASEALTLQLNDPAIAQMAARLDEAAESVALASKSTADGAEHLNKATADIEQAVHRLTRPPSLAKRIGTTVLGIGAQLGSIFAGFVK
jgi:hypothetical protein